MVITRKLIPALAAVALITGCSSGSTGLRASGPIDRVGSVETVPAGAGGTTEAPVTTADTPSPTVPAGTAEWRELLSSVGTYCTDIGYYCTSDQLPPDVVASYAAVCSQMAGDRHPPIGPDVELNPREVASHFDCQYLSEGDESSGTVEEFYIEVFDGAARTFEDPTSSAQGCVGAPSACREAGAAQVRFGISDDRVGTAAATDGSVSVLMIWQQSSTPFEEAAERLRFAVDTLGLAIPAELFSPM